MSPLDPVLRHRLDREALSRRSLLKWGGSVAGAALLPPLSPYAQAADEAPHFFLNICISGGLDATYTFDARPLQMTDKTRSKITCTKII